jgi:hypothetical protein
MTKPIDLRSLAYVAAAAFAALALTAAAAIAALALTQAQQPSLRVLSPQDGAVIQGGNVELRMEVQGVELSPRPSSNTAYVQLRLDEAPPVKAYAGTFTFQGVTPGNHLLRIELRRSNGSELNPPVRTQVRFAVRAAHR